MPDRFTFVQQNCHAVACVVFVQNLVVIVEDRLHRMKPSLPAHNGLLFQPFAFVKAVSDRLQVYVAVFTAFADSPRICMKLFSVFSKRSRKRNQSFCTHMHLAISIPRLLSLSRMGPGKSATKKMPRRCRASIIPFMSLAMIVTAHPRVTS
ncbi:Glycine/D-amino acid oxidase [Pseudomonas syringae pv. actinidiae]|uniref:Glycine/D-amino acid oxidase n=1 Tax=Pseudomonas syringae pv. actinidiae TaxID=103796 RepID=A0A2V0QEN7_PSESF|nr:Glycine/D-amino acid oxidase [Pseudomonas syringae pv. actinidiae]